MSTIRGESLRRFGQRWCVFLVWILWLGGAQAAPLVSIVNPVANTSWSAPATLTLTADANAGNEGIAQVAFYHGSNLIGTRLEPPYTLTWSNVQAGSYTLTAQATDSLGASTVSSPVTVTVIADGAVVFYLHGDHLNTPRLVTNEQNVIIWRNLPLAEPFGVSPPEEDPDGDGVPFTLNLRFPGQYFDKETNLNYNYYRDYDPSNGRYIQSDPIGLDGGINTYGYALGNPVKYTDPLGLEVQFCCAPVDISWIPDPLAAILPKHCWLKTDTYESGMAADCSVPGQQCSDKPGADTTTKNHNGQSTDRKGAECTPLKNIDEQCVNEKIKPGLPTGTWHPYNQCQSFSAGVMGQCRYGPNIGPTLPPPSR